MFFHILKKSQIIHPTFKFGVKISTPSTPLRAPLHSVKSRLLRNLLMTHLAYPSGYSGGGGLGKGNFWASEAVITHDGSYVYCICRVHQSIAIFKGHFL